MKIYIYKIFILLVFLIEFANLYPTITLKIFNGNNLIDEQELNFQFYLKYNKIISSQEFSSIYKISYVSEESKFTPILKNKNEKQILLFDSFDTFSSIKSSNMSNIIIFPDNFLHIINKELLLHFECKKFIFFITKKEYDNLMKYDFNHNENIYIKIFIPEELSKNFIINEKSIPIPGYYFLFMFMTSSIFFLFLFFYHFSIPLRYKDYWLHFISQFYIFIPFRFILFVILSIKLTTIQNMRGLLPSAPGFFVILAVPKSIIKTNIITTILLANEGLYIFENMIKIALKMTVYNIQFFFLTIFFILVLSFPFHFNILIFDCIIILFISIHALTNYKKLKKTLLNVILTKKKYKPILKLKISIWIKQNILLNMYFISLIVIYFFSKFTTNKMLIDEIICLKNDMLEYCVENLFFFSFCYLYRPRHLKKEFFIVYTEKFERINLKFFYTELDEKSSIRSKVVHKIRNKNFINKYKIETFQSQQIKKPIIILNPKLINQINAIENSKNKDLSKTLNLSEKFLISIGKIKVK